MHEKLIILDFGSQTTQLIGRRVRELNMYCEIVPYNKFPHDATDVKGVILSGSPYSVYDENAFKADLTEIRGKYPVLGICYGAQFLAYTSGGNVEPANSREYGRANLSHIDGEDELLKGIHVGSQIWMSHGDTITVLPDKFKVIASTDDVRAAAYHVEGEQTWGVQFHPEVFHSTDGTKLLDNFLNICGCAKDWTPASFIESTVAELKEQLGDDKVILALSGGVDSSVTAVLLNKAIGKNLTCIFVDHGLLRKNEREQVCEVFGEGGQFDINFVCVDARDRFYKKLAGQDAPERKRKIIGEEFIRVFEDEAKKIGAVDFLAQGTIYPDVVESGLGGESATIKSHHNVGGLPDYVDFKEIVEPLRDLFKDEVRQAGRELGLPEYLVARQPFPGPGLAIRIIGDVTPEKVAIVQDADAIWREEIDKLPMAQRPSQYFAALTNMRSVGVMGDERTYDYAIALRAVTTTDFMTAEVTILPTETITTAANRIVNEVKNINRVMFDYTTKPPATIEFE